MPVIQATIQAAETNTSNSCQQNSAGKDTDEEPNVEQTPAYLKDCVPNFNEIEYLFYAFAFTRVIFFLIPMITGSSF